ncbi:uncharacterized protein CLUP02_01129 [Colletotrichum lupini]|uniref:Uncharacterized protein n=1 Tax=Colletotrichum lupini TaxID=145971 RepID=A0A9Q8SCE0_9PEZI|nr:uncharacterized protein CLUP02_01129 [Colletotrichum lupini]UQC74478.1 hypothetical protein CLUP02_01129 [Colletotrichum lupini]
MLAVLKQHVNHVTCTPMRDRAIAPGSGHIDLSSATSSQRCPIWLEWTTAKSESDPSELSSQMNACPSLRTMAAGQAGDQKTGFGSITSRLHAAAGGNLVLSLADWLEARDAVVVNRTPGPLIAWLYLDSHDDHSLSRLSVCEKHGAEVSDPNQAKSHWLLKRVGVMSNTSSFLDIHLHKASDGRRCSSSWSLMRLRRDSNMNLPMSYGLAHHSAVLIKLADRDQVCSGEGGYTGYEYETMSTTVLSTDTVASSKSASLHLRDDRSFDGRSQRLRDSFQPIQ